MFDGRKNNLIFQYFRSKLLPDWGGSTLVNKASYTDHVIHVSILITCYNYEKYVIQAIDSILESAIKNLNIEIIIVDDASVDNSIELIKNKILETSMPIRLIQTWWNVGVSRARNIALNQARGEFVFILDADNIVEASALHQLYWRAKNVDADAAYGPILKIMPDGSEGELISSRPFDSKMLLSGPYIDAMALFRLSSLKLIGGYDTKLMLIIGGWEDYFLWLEFASRKFHVTFYPIVIGKYFVKPNSMVNIISDEEKNNAMKYLQVKYAHILKN